MRQKIPIKYFYVNSVIDVFIIITLTLLISFVINMLK